MDLNKIIQAERINLKMQAQTKEEAIEELTEILVKTGAISDKNKFIKDVYVREEIGETGMGGYIAIPHGKSKHVKKTAIAIGRTSEEIKWESLDGKGVKLIFLFAVPEDEKGTIHVRLLAQVASRLGDDDVCKQLLSVESAEDIFTIMTNN
jgi:PTS system fructose-specific IIA component